MDRFDPGKPTFLKTDWSDKGIGWVLIQPADNDESVAAIKLLLKAGECNFGSKKSGARLQPITFGSRCCYRRKRSIIHLFEKQHASVGPLGKIVDINGDHISGGCMIARQLKKYWSMMARSQ